MNEIFISFMWNATLHFCQSLWADISLEISFVCVCVCVCVCFNFVLFLNLKHCISFAKHQNESAFFKSSLYIWNFWVYILLKPRLKDFENKFASMWNECNLC